MNDLIMIVIRFFFVSGFDGNIWIAIFQIYGIAVEHETYNLTNFRSFITLLLLQASFFTGINILTVSNAMIG